MESKLTAEEILKGKPYKRGSNINSLPHYHYNVVVNAMNEFASLQTEPLQKEIETLNLEWYIEKKAHGITLDQLLESRRQAEELQNKLAVSERFRIEDAASHNDEKYQDWQRNKMLQEKISQLEQEVNRLKEEESEFLKHQQERTADFLKQIQELEQENKALIEGIEDAYPLVIAWAHNATHVHVGLPIHKEHQELIGKLESLLKKGESE